jgi:triacylglycerol lipase
MTIPQLRAPIVLVHGFMGFDEVKVCGCRIASYFPGIPEFLREGGNRVILARLSPLGAVAARARELQITLDRESPDEPVHILAHSMGGLDARYMISRLGMADRVLSLTTIATPHRGTAFADWGVRRLRRIVEPVLQLFSLPGQGFLDLTTEKCRLFNEQVPDAPGVRYFAVAGKHDGDWFTPEWHLPHQIVLEAEGPNDGMVSIASATYGERTEIWEGDHLNLVNWQDRGSQVRGTWKDRTADYGALIRRLADQGFRTRSKS